jgi:hypothetical protein
MNPEASHEAVTVWMLHSGTSQNGIKGILSLEDRRLVFRAEGSRIPGAEFRLEDVRRVRRVLGSPIMEIRQDASGGPRIVGFYFVKPPSLEARTGFQAGREITTRRRARKDSVKTLREWNAIKKPEVIRWVDMVRTAKQGIA